MALFVSLLECRPLLGGGPRDDRSLRVLPVEEPELLDRAPPPPAIEGARGLRGVVELAARVDGVAGDHEVAVAQVTDDALMPGGVSRCRREAHAAVAEEVEGEPEAGVGVDLFALVSYGAVVERVR